MVQENELVALILALIGLPLLYIMIPRERKHVWFFLGSYLALTAGFIFTVAEGFVLPDLFNALEHWGRAIGAVLFAAGTIVMVLILPRSDGRQ